MITRARYVKRVLDLYAKIPGTLHRVLRADRRVALELYDRRVSIETVEAAFVLALARRTFRDQTHQIEPIRCLAYLLPVIQELVQEPLLPEYIPYLKHKLISAGAYPQA